MWHNYGTYSLGKTPIYIRMLRYLENFGEPSTVPVHPDDLKEKDGRLKATLEAAEALGVTVRRLGRE